MILFFNGISDEIFENSRKTEELELKTKFNTFSSNKQTLLLYMHKITDSIQKLENIDDSTGLLKILSDLKNALDKVRNTESDFKKVFNILDSIKLNNPTIANDVTSYNNISTRLQISLADFMLEFERLSKLLFNNVELQFPNSTVIDNGSPKVNYVSEAVVYKPEPIQSKSGESSNKINTTEDNNVLLISEKQNMVFLPYKIKDLEAILNRKYKKYKTIENLIKTEYIVSLNRFKNPIISRFKEAYNLMKNKEQASFIASITLALELSFNSTLNPAVIAACKNKDELDIYLDCLDSKELEDFKIFEIKYEINPMIK